MIPEPIDPALLREHAFQDIGDLNIVLSKETYTEFGGFKSIFKYGLGYFNYTFGLSREVHERNIPSMLRSHVLEHYGAYSSAAVVLAVLCYIALMQVQGSYMGASTKAEKDGDDVYYVKV
ncbi:LANO_0G02014g1_1 [Lachancea nothofagi CBS 11611]|uniref:LANO_0G02014g1_1 n=1 Tax=Lachancea nothofagi CBS 11611 TaxID=1266666 RepID=A0A1G4KEU7_9SACH|nr:LANO_0G02014g1_1 [Lachancea nothofagi CBS 11611]